MSGPILIRGDARALPLPDSSVDLIVTSPPYFGLRSYTDGGEHYDAQIGSEATPTEFLDALIVCTAEMVRVLKPSGSIFLNLGDKYDKRKSLGMLPERYRIRAVDELGLIARAVLIWSKPNSLPESVTDRVRRSHEDWVHLTRAPRYFASVDEIREAHSSAVVPGRRHDGAAFGAIKNGGGDGSRHSDGHPLGKLPGSVWEIATQPLRVPAELGIDHFAAFPMEWPRRIIKGWSPTDGVVLDPFSGTGTTALVATMLGRTGIGVDMPADYCRLAQWRCADPKQRARATQAKVRPLRDVPELDVLDLSDAPVAAPTLLDLINQAGTNDEFTALWRAHRDEWTDEHTAVVKSRLEVAA